MPYLDIRDLPAAQVARYSVEQKRVFLKAFNEAYERYGADEHRAFATAHAAAKRIRDLPSPPSGSGKHFTQE
jgi:cation transport regulator